jgi:hypothetical protein
LKERVQVQQIVTEQQQQQQHIALAVVRSVDIGSLFSNSVSGI